MIIDKSLEYWDKAKEIIPGGTQTLSKGPNMFAFGVSPIYLEYGEGCYVWDVDGNRYIDYPLALGPITLGYNHPSTVNAVCNQIRKGSTFSLMNVLEIEVAELLIDCIPCAEMVRFAKNGADVTSAAVRLSRLYTNREHILYCGYHGWHDWYMADNEYSAGIPVVMKEYIHSFRYNDIESLKVVFEKLKGKIAAVIMEPVSTTLPENNFLQQVKEITHANEAILIFDEIVTGFRLSLGGAQEYYNVVPDLACFGKGMANGLPISALVGKKEIMINCIKMFFSTTYGGETLSLAAAKATINEMKNQGVFKHFWENGSLFKNGVIEIVEKYSLSKYIKVIGLAPKFWIEFINTDGTEYTDLKGLFFQEAIIRGILIGGLQYISFSHSELIIKETLKSIEEVCYTCKKAIDEDKVIEYLKSEPPKDVFDRYERTKN